MTHARWQNTKSRQLRVLCEHRLSNICSKKVGILYVPTLLEIVQRNLVLEGPRHLLSLVMRIKLCCTKEEIEILKPCLNLTG